ncbi:MAG: antibiotic biosynthesis monooxygenase family protein [Chloroflexia bacterium]
MLVVMVRIPIGSAAEGARIEERFRNRAGLVDNEPGFLGFELLKGDSEFISVTRWASREDLNRWMLSQGHAQAHGKTPGPTGGGHPQAGKHGEAETEEARPSGGVPTASTLVYEVVIPAGVHA